MWAQMMVAMLGIWLTASPAVFGYDRPANVSDWVIGPLVASFATIAIWEATRGLRWVNLLLAVWLVAAPWIFGFDWTPLLNSVLVGLAVAGLSLVRGRIDGRYGGGWSSLWKPELLAR